MSNVYKKCKKSTREELALRKILFSKLSSQITSYACRIYNKVIFILGFVFFFIRSNLSCDVSETDRIVVYLFHYSLLYLLHSVTYQN